MNIFRYIVFLLCFTFTLNLFAQTDLEKADDAFWSAQYATALDYYKKAFLQNPDNRKLQAELTFKIAECYRKVNLTKDAERWYQRAILLKYPDPLAVLYYAEMLRQNRKLNEAIDEYKKFTVLVPDDPRGKIGVEKCKELFAKNQINVKSDDKSANSQTDMIARNETPSAAIKESNEKDEVSKDLEEQKLGQTQDNKDFALKVDSSLIKIMKYKEVKDVKALGKAYNDIAGLYYRNGDPGKAIEYFEQSIETREKANDKAGASSALSNLGVALYSSYKYDDALKCFQKALKLKQEINDKQGESKMLYRISNLYREKKDLKKTVEFMERALTNDEASGNKKEVVASINNIGVVLLEMKNIKKSVEYFERALQKSNEAGDEKSVAITLNNLGNAEFDRENITRSLDHYLRSAKIKEKLNYKKGLAITYYNIGNVYREKNDNTKAFEYYSRSEKIAGSQNYFELLYDVNIALSEMYNLKGDCGKAFQSYKAAMPYRQFSVNLGARKQISEMADKYNDAALNSEEISLLTEEITRQKLIAQELAQKKEMELALKNSEIAKKESDIKAQRIQKYISFLGIAFMLVVAFLIFRSYKQKKKQNEIINKQNEDLKFANIEISEKNEELNQQKEEISAQRDHIEDQKKEITDSINYAKRIQQAVFPSAEFAEKSLGEHFILFKPKDIVSGDFYWSTKINDILIFTVADCTGHGVPGAFMSMLGVSFLNEIVRKKEVNNSGLVLDNLRASIIEALKQKGAMFEQKDGMDIVMCALNTKTKVLSVACANNPLFIVSADKELKIIEADKQPVAIYENMQPFTNKEIQLNKGDCLYLASDGFQDQFGGPKGKKFMVKQLKEILVDISGEPMQKQKQILEQKLVNWIGNLEQVDDITLMGFRIK